MVRKNKVSQTQRKRVSGRTEGMCTIRDERDENTGNALAFIRKEEHT